MDKINKTNKDINSRCVCGKGLTWLNDPKIMVEPCEHIFHIDCIKKYTKCPLCNIKITKTNTLEELKTVIKNMKNNDKNKRKYYQKYVDVVSVSDFSYLSRINDKLLVPNMIDFLGLLTSVPFLSGYEDGKRGSHELLCLMNAKIVTSGLDRINHSIPRVYISNHTSYLDFVVLFNLLKSGFLSSSSIKESWYGRLIMDIVPLLLLERSDKSSNTVDKMKQYVKKYGSICLFPEGMISHPDTITRFRTGAFHIGYPIYPIVITYNNVIYDNDPSIMVKKILSCEQITINVDVLPIEQPPFTSERIEDIRKKMAKTGNMALSRVSNRDIVDNKIKT